VFSGLKATLEKHDYLISPFSKLSGMRKEHQLYGFLTILLIGVFLMGGCAEQPSMVEKENFTAQLPVTPEAQTSAPLSKPLLQTGEEAEEEPEQVAAGLPWKYGGVAIPGRYADAEVVYIGNGRYRMYYSAEPEVPGFEGQVYSAVSQDGVTWMEEKGIRMKWATFPSVIALPDGRYRMYFQNGGVIRSALSSDGLSWNMEAGVRVDTANEAGLNLDNVAAPTVIEEGGSYIMVYRGTINQKYPAKVPNDNTQLLLWATSKDGLTFKREGIALDSRNQVFMGMMDGPEFIRWDDGSLRLYFWSYRGIYHTSFKDGKFSQDVDFDYTTLPVQGSLFPENPPGDPTLVKINNKWFMYYGQHAKGIYYATLREG
jgi:predicted GH43/DUF377 family glycosyl hydrolase